MKSTKPHWAEDGAATCAKTLQSKSFVRQIGTKKKIMCRIKRSFCNNEKGLTRFCFEIYGYNKLNAHFFSFFFFFQDLFLYRDMLLIFLICVGFFKHVSVNVVLFLLVCLEFNTYIRRAFIVKVWGQTGSSNT